jgi:hypothetical protein
MKHFIHLFHFTQHSTMRHAAIYLHGLQGDSSVIT